MGHYFWLGEGEGVIPVILAEVSDYFTESKLAHFCELVFHLNFFGLKAVLTFFLHLSYYLRRGA